MINSSEEKSNFFLEENKNFNELKRKRVSEWMEETVQS